MTDQDPCLEPTLTAGVRRGVGRFPGAQVTFAGAAGEESTNIASLHATALRVAAGLHELGVRPGEKIAMQLPNVVEAVITAIAALELGLTLVPIVSAYGHAETSFILERSAATVLVVPAEWRGVRYVDRVPESRRPSTLRHVVVVGDDIPDGCISWSTLACCAGVGPPIDPEPADQAMLLYTSGTTGEPKGVVHTQATLAAEIAQMLRFNDDEIGDVALVAFPVGHMAGVLGAVRAFFRDRHTIFMDGWDPSVAARLIEEHGVTNTAGTPFHLSSLFEAADRDRRSLASISSFLLGATTVSPDLVAAADERGIRAFRCYGSTEQPTVSCALPSDSFRDRATTDGHLLPGVEVRIVDDDDQQVPPGVAGEILSRGVDLSPGYSDPTLDAGARTADGWYRSGDIGTVDERGMLTVTDRKKDIIIRGGENIASREVEDVLAAHPAVREVAVVGVPDARYGERVCAVVVVEPDSRVTLEMLRHRVISAGLSRQKAPELLVTLDVLPRTPAGKIQKNLLRQIARGSSAVIWIGAAFRGR